jgi:hypothetical protein
MIGGVVAGVALTEALTDHHHRNKFYSFISF